MPACTVCAHDKRTEIDQCLAEQRPLRPLAAEFGLSVTALHRHSRHDSKQQPKIQSKLSPRQARFVREAAKGGSIEGAMVRAGYAPSTAKQGMAGVSQSKEMQELLRTTINQRIPVSKLVDRIAEGLDAKEIKFFAHEGRVVDRKATPDYRERREYITLAAKLGRYFEENAPALTVEIDARPLQEKVTEMRMLLDELAQLEEEGTREPVIDITPGD